MKGYPLFTTASARLNGVADFRVAGRDADRLFGAYYTHSNAADSMAKWTVRQAGERVLEPSFGDGAFLLAIRLTCPHFLYQGL